MKTSAINTPEKPRRPEVSRRAAQLKAQHPEWTENECMAKAKAEHFSRQQDKGGKAAAV